MAAACAQQLRVHRLAVGLLALLFCGNTIITFTMRAAHRQATGSMAMPGFLVALFLALIFTPWMRDFAVRKRMVDTTSSVRKIHVKAVPRIGGVAFVLAWYIAIGLMLAVDERLRAALMARAPRSFIFLAGGLAVAVLGTLDDVYGLRARTKLIVQLVIAFVVCVAGFTVGSIELPGGTVLHLGWFAIPFTMLWIVGVMNAMNLIDGLDGLAGGISTIALGVIFVLSLSMSLPTLGVYAAALAGAVLGFLVYNFNPASIFMGDSGSLFLGYFLAVTLLVSSKQTTTGTLPLAVPLLVLGVPVADTLLAICRRAIRGKGLFSADREHLHHGLMKRGLSHRNAVFVLYSACVVLAAAGLAVAFGSPLVDCLVCIALAGAVLWVCHSFGLFKLDLKVLRRERRKNLKLRAALNSIVSELKDANQLSDVMDSLSALVPAVSAQTVTARLGSIPAEHQLRILQDEAVQMRFPLRHGEQELGQLHVVWGDAREGVEPDHALAIEELCKHVIRAVRRLSVGLEQTATPPFGVVKLHRRSSGA